jgi:DnaJ-class molecular chaperone
MKISISWTTKKQCDFCGGHGLRIKKTPNNKPILVQCSFCGGSGKRNINHEKSLKLWES